MTAPLAPPAGTANKARRPVSLALLAKHSRSLHEHVKSASSGNTPKLEKTERAYHAMLLKVLFRLHLERQVASTVALAATLQLL